MCGKLRFRSFGQPAPGHGRWRVGWQELVKPYFPESEKIRFSEAAVDFAPDLSDRLLQTSRTATKMATADENREIAVSTISAG